MSEALQDEVLVGVRVAGQREAGPARPDISLRGLLLHAHVTDDSGRVRQVMADEAQRWTYVLRSRQRWVHDARAREQQQADARATMARLGLGPDELQTLAQQSTLVVRVPFQHEAVGWEGRIFPGESVLAAATREQRLGASGRPSALTIIRELQVQHEVEGDWALLPQHAVALTDPLRVMFVNTLPTELREHWSVDEELAQFRRSLPGVRVALHVLDYPSAAELTEALGRHRPQLLHIAGMDSHQGLRELVTVKGDAAWVEPVQWDAAAHQLRVLPLARATEIMADTKRMLDGLLLRGSHGLPQLLPAQTLGRVLAQSGAQPYLTVFNVWNSSARLAPMLIAEGATLAAVGFQDAFDDSLAEFMLAQLRQRLFTNGFDLPDAFRRSWEEVRALPESVDATGVTLWVGAPVFVDAATKARHEARRAELKARKLVAPSAAVRCEIEPFPELNYAVLHNAQPLFKRFVLACELPEQAAPVDVDVAVHMGAEVARFQRRVQMQHRRERLTDKIHVPLTAEVARSVHEAINTSLSVCVRQGGEVLYHDSHRLRLLPVDQWRDNRRDGRWLPSFVLPRDPAVMRAVAQAQRYNRVLRDDPAAGFEGYQCVPESATPDAIDEAALHGVDRQVEAIWATLLHDWRLSYINPPPSYSGELDSQRLRVPSTVQADGAGTCIDLALLFAACLELVDIYPVVFLLKGHALPGWWRHSSFQEEYQQMTAASYSDVVVANASGNSAANAQTKSWHTGEASWAEVKRWIRERKLVPIETVRLTEHCGFVEAIAAGVQALDERADYDSMLDIVTARRAQVTPLPLLKDNA
jgi:hypothetical protein